MRGMVIDPRGRIQRRWFIYDLILPNIAAAILIVILRIIDTPLTDVALGAITILLIWSANFAAPIARLHDLGLPSSVHFLVVVVVFGLTTIGPVGSPGELIMRVGDWINVLQGQASTLPEVDGASARVGGIIALAQIAVLSLVKGKSGPNRFGPDPREKDQAKA